MSDDRGPGPTSDDGADEPVEDDVTDPVLDGADDPVEDDPAEPVERDPGEDPEQAEGLAEDSESVEDDDHVVDQPPADSDGPETPPGEDDPEGDHDPVLERALEPRRLPTPDDVVEKKPRDLDWVVPVVAVIVILGLVALTVIWTLDGNPLFGGPSRPTREGDVTRTATASATPTPSPTPTVTPPPAPDPSVAAPSFISFGAPTSISCVAPTGDEPVPAVAFALSWGSVDAESATVTEQGGDPQPADATGAFSTTFPCPAASATYTVVLEGRGGQTAREVTVTNVGYTG